MRHSFKERMSMTKETLTLKAKSARGSITPPITAASATTVTAGRDPSKGKSPSAITRLLETAISNSAYVFIQLRHGAGYRGLPTKLDQVWLTMEDADVLGTKRNMHVGQLLIQVKDGSYIAHIHTTDGQSPCTGLAATLGGLK
jgi:hypothetical protein